jgi:hypothetical protein
MGELRTSNASSFVHNGQKPATKQRVVVICVARENVFDERHGFFRVVFHMFRKAFTLMNSGKDKPLRRLFHHLNA